MPQLSVRGVFEECQKAAHLHGGLLKKLQKVYDDMMFEEFWEEFEHHLKYSMIVFQREPAVERTVEFVVKFAMSVLKPKKTDADDSEEEEEEELHPFIAKLFDFILEVHNARDRAVRFRSCQIVNKLLHAMGENAQIDDDLYSRIFNNMLYRLKDKFPVVRIQAVFALARLQDPSDKDCPVINAYIFLLAFDPNADVRRAILSTIAATKKTLPGILERARDVKEGVRRQAYQIIAEKIHMKALTIAQRVKLLKDGLNDRSDVVKQACIDKLVQAWLRQFGGNILDVLKGLDVEESSEVAEQALKVMFSKSQLKQLVEDVDLLDDKLVIPHDKLTCENVFYWRCLSDYLRSLGNHSEEYLDKILPTGLAYCEYIKGVVEMMRDEEDLERKLMNEFILQQLIELGGSLDLADEVGRKNLNNLIRDMLLSSHVSHSAVEPLLKQLCRIRTDDAARIQNLVEVIADIRQPISTVESGLSEDQKRMIEVQAASIRVKMHEVREELDESVQQQDFSRAGELKEKLAELEQEKEEVLEGLQSKVEEIRTEKTDPQTLLKCLTIASVMLQDVTLPGLTATLQTLIESLILPGIQNHDPAVRRLAVKSLGLCCQMSKSASKTHLLLFIQISQVDHMAVQVTALEALCDILLTFGLEAFTDENNMMNAEDDEADDQPDEMMEEQKKGLETIKSLITILTSLIDSEMPEVRTVAAEGLAKLVLSGRVMSAKLISRLLLLWYNPLTEDDTHLRHCLGTFFPVFAFASQANQEVISEAVLPTLRTLFNAPLSSPLCEVNAVNVAKLLTELTSVRNLVQNKNDATFQEAVQDHSIHNTIAVKVCNEILSEPNSLNTRVLTKTLTMLELNGKQETDIQDLKVLLEQMTEDVKDKQCIRAVEKFAKIVNDLAKSYRRERQVESTTNDDDLTQATTELEAATESMSLDDASSQASRMQVSDSSQEGRVVTDLGLDIESSQELFGEESQESSFHTADEGEGSMEGAKEHEKENKGDKKTKGNGRATKSQSKKPKKKLLPKNSPPVKDESSGSDFENSVFASPTPVRRSARVGRRQKSTTSGMGDAKVNLEELLSDESGEESKSRSKRSKKSKVLTDILSDIDNGMM